MTTKTPPGNTVLVLSPPIVNGQTTPVTGAHIGLSLVAYDLVNDGEGAVVLVDPPLSGTMDPGDVMELWLVGESAVLDSETIADPNARTTLRIPKGRLHPDRVNKLYYTIRRGSSNIGTSEPPLEILYNRIRPGLKDRLTEPGGHSELNLLLPDTIKNGVGPDFVSAEICVAYPYCRAYDLITLKCNGELLEPKPKVDAGQAPTPPNPGSEVPITICFTITRDFLGKAKRLDKKLHFSFTVTDQLGNGPDTDAPWSPVQTVDEDLDGELLPMPILREVPNDSNDDPGIIDLEKLAGENLSVVVLTSDARFMVGHDVIATYTAINTGQPADVVVVVRGKVEQEFGQKIPCVLKVPNDQIFASSVVTVIYELREPNGNLVGTSNAANATVTGAPPIKLLPPALVDVVEPIDVLAYPNGVTVRISFPEALTGDRARLVEVNAPAGSPQFPLEDFVDQQVNIVLSAAFLAARHGKVMELRWNLNRNGGQAGKSAPVKLSVLTIVDGDRRLPTPFMPDAREGVLDIQKLGESTTCIIEPWSFIEAGARFTLKIDGLKNDGTIHIIFFDQNAIVDPNELTNGISRKISSLNFSPIATNTVINANFTLHLNGSDINFPTLEINAVNYKFVSFEGFEGLEPQEIFTPVSTPALTIIKSSSSGHVHIYNHSSTYPPNTISQNCLSISLAEVTLQLNFVCSSMSFWQTAADTSTAHVSCFDDMGRLISSRAIAYTYYYPNYETFTGQRINKIVISSLKEIFYLDGFSFQQ